MLMRILAVGAVLCFPLAGAASARYHFSKLTQAGVEEITIQEPKKIPDPAQESSLKALSVQRSLTSLEKSKWKALAKKQDLKIVILGDTGCRLKQSKGGSGGSFQDCRSLEAWPFPRVMKQVAKENPDLILHVGDYHYRETCPKGNPCEKMSSVTGYGWGPWQQDFFEPAQVSFQKAPWIFVRGNHEDCHRAHLGWRLLLANESWAEGTCLDYEEPDLIPLKDLLLVNLDSSSISEYPEQDPAQVKLWTDRFQKLSERVQASGLKKIWIVTHKPFYGLVKLGAGAAPVNMNLRRFLDASPLKDKVQLVLAGHIHISQMLKPKSGPLQFVLGNGGTALDNFKDFVDQTGAAELGFESIRSENPGFGYAVFRRRGPQGHWSISFKNEKGHEVSQCQLDLEKKTCNPR